jgi:hypothetical protein
MTDAGSNAHRDGTPQRVTEGGQQPALGIEPGNEGATSGSIDQWAGKVSDLDSFRDFVRKMAIRCQNGSVSREDALSMIADVGRYRKINETFDLDEVCNIIELAANTIFPWCSREPRCRPTAFRRSRATSKCPPFADLLDPPTHQRMIRLAHLHGRNLRQREIDRFVGLGIKALDLGNPWPVLADRVVFTGDFFVFADDVGERGEAAFTFIVISNAGFIDIVAWHPQTNRLAIWLGNGFAVGERQIHHPYPLMPGLPVFRSPIGWLRNGRRGIVMVRAKFTDVVLAAVPVLIAEDEQHQRDLQEVFPVGIHGPKIMVSQPAPIKTEIGEVLG